WWTPDMRYFAIPPGIPERTTAVQPKKCPCAPWVAGYDRSCATSVTRHALLKEQKGKCGCCKLLFRYEDILEVHHVDGDHKNNKGDNLMLIHGHCHDQITAQMLRTLGKGSVTEEPCARKRASTVLKQRCEG